MSSSGYLDARAPAVLVDGLSKRYGDLGAVLGIVMLAIAIAEFSRVE